MRFLFEYSRENIAKTLRLIWNRLLTLASAKDRSNGMERFPKLYDVLEKLSRYQYNEWCQYREKTFQSFYARRHELINVAFMFHIVDRALQNRPHVTKLYYSVVTTDGLQSFNRKLFCHGIFVGIYSDAQWEENDKTMWCINNTSYGK